MNIAIAGLATLYWPFAVAEGLKSRSDAKLVAAATMGVSEEEITNHLGMKPAEFAKRYAINLYMNEADMFADEQIDALAIGSRHTQHAEWVERLAKFGKNIFIPKTYVTTMKDAARIEAAEKSSGILIAVGPSARFIPAIAAAKSAIDEGRIGKPFAMRVCHHHGTIDVFGEHDFYRDAAEGGPELSLGWYVTDLVLHFMNRGVARVWADYKNYNSPGSPFMDFGRIAYRMADGAMATCDMYFCNRFSIPTWEMEITGPNGAIYVRQEGDDMGNAVTHLLSEAGKTPLSPPPDVRNWELFWVDDFLNGNKPTVGTSFAAEVTKLSLAARKSAENQLPVDILPDGTSTRRS